MTRRAVGILLIFGLAGLVGGLPSGFAKDEPDAKAEKAAPKGPRYVNKAAGVQARGPEGWKMSGESAGPVEWTRLVTFFDPGTDADIVFSVRKKTTSSAQSLLAKVRREWGKTARLKVSAMRAVEASPMAAISHVIVDGEYTIKPKAKKGAVAGPPVPYSVNATYFLGPDGEYLLYAKAQKTHWSRVLPRLRKVRKSIQFARAEAAAAGEGARTFRHDRLGFTCIYAADASVVVKGSQIVSFEPASAADPAIEVYRVEFEGAVEADSRRIVTFYVEDQGGEAERSDTLVAGKEASLVTAKAEIGGAQRSIRIASFKRADGKVWRIKLTGPVDQDAKIDAAFKTFVDGFKLTRSDR